MYRKVITLTSRERPDESTEFLYIGELFDGDSPVLIVHFSEYSSYTTAEQSLDVLIVEILRDQFEQGLLDDLAAAIEAEGVTSRHIPSWMTDVEHAPVGWPVDCEGI